jgi:hypothetical protein
MLLYTIGMVARSSLSSNVIIALILLGLGVGNLVIGTTRLEEIKPLSHKSLATTESSDSKFFGLDSALLSSESTTYRSAQLEQKIERRIGFYRTVVKGGALFIVLGTAWLLLTFMTYLLQKAQATREAEKKTSTVE